MFPTVQSGFRAFNTEFEGCVPFMYLDIKGLVTVAVGNLVDPVELAQALPFRFKNKPGITDPGSLATPDQIAAEWQMLKNNQNLAHQGFKACEPITRLELSDDSIDALVQDRLTRNESFLKHQPAFQNFDDWPADAQLGLLSMAWAMGPAAPGRFPKFRAACANLDFHGAAAECKMDETGNPGLIPRNKANFTLFSNAAIVTSSATGSGLQRSTLFYPQVLLKGSHGPQTQTVGG